MNIIAIDAFSTNKYYLRPQLSTLCYQQSCSSTNSTKCLFVEITNLSNNVVGHMHERTFRDIL